MTGFNLEEIVKQHVDDVHTALKGFEGKTATLQNTIAALEDEQKALRRAALAGMGGPAPIGKATHEEKAALVQFIKTGMNGLTGEAGGFNVPLTIAADVEAAALKMSPVRAVADVRRIDTPNYRMIVNVRGTTSGWVGETASRPVTTAPSIEAVEPKLGTIYSLIEASEEIVADFAGDFERWLVEDVAAHLAEAESTAFINGDGTNKPTGFLAGTINASGDATRTFGHLQYIPTGNATTLGTDLVGKLLGMIFATKASYRQSGEAVFMSSTAVIEELSKLKDDHERPLFYPSLREGTPGTLLGFPLIEAEAMPAVASGTFPIAFGNFRRGYTIVDRAELTVLRDPFTKKGAVQFYVQRRVGGAVRNSEAIKLLKVASA